VSPKSRNEGAALVPSDALKRTVSSWSDVKGEMGIRQVDGFARDGLAEHGGVVAARKRVHSLALLPPFTILQPRLSASAEPDEGRGGGRDIPELWHHVRSGMR
jgi:hypothetical protein